MLSLSSLIVLGSGGLFRSLGAASWSSLIVLVSSGLFRSLGAASWTSLIVLVSGGLFRSLGAVSWSVSGGLFRSLGAASWRFLEDSSAGGSPPKLSPLVETHSNGQMPHQGHHFSS